MAPFFATDLGVNEGLKRRSDGEALSSRIRLLERHHPNSGGDDMCENSDQQARILVDMASDPEILSRMYPGWRSWM
jgi:hypothetical protein